MAKKKIQEKKAKAKERATETKKNKDRLFAARRKRYDRELEKEVKANRDRQEPIRNSNSRLEKIQEHLDTNLEVLKALEQEYMDAQMKRSDLQESLEAEGYHSLEEKMEALKQKSVALAETVQDQIIEEEKFKHEAKLYVQDKAASKKITNKPRIAKKKG